MVRCLERVHPGLFRYQTPAAFDARVKQLRSRLRNGASLREGYLAISQFLNPIQCGHTYTNFYNQNDLVKTTIFGGQNKLPFTGIWHNRRFVIAQDFSAAGLPRGTEVDRINGKRAARVFSELMTIARADGANDGKREAYLALNGRTEWEATDIFLPYFAPLSGSSFRLSVRRPGDRSWTEIMVPAISREDRLRFVARAEAEKGSLWPVESVRADVAKVTMDDWAFYDGKVNWKARLRAVFQDLNDRQVPHLILDIRQCEGGLSVGDEILKYLVEKPISLPAADRYTRYQKLSRSVLPYVATWDRSFRDWSNVTVPDRKGWYRLVRASDVAAQTIQPADIRYRRKVYVLISATNSSATYQFASLCKSTKLATLVGQTTGGNQRGINGGGFFFTTLPNSGIEFDLPLIGYYPRGSFPNRGVEPDVRTFVRGEDLATGRDAELDAVLRLVGPER